LEAIFADDHLVLETEDSLFQLIHRLSLQNLSYFPLLAFVRFEYLSDPCANTAFEFISNSFELLTFGIWSQLGPRLTLPVTPPLIDRQRFLALSLDSKIISPLPNIFSRLKGKAFRLLYRGSRDGFGGGDFHRCCDQHPNTMTLILSDNGSIFGGFTPLVWSCRNTYVSDPSRQSFVFTIKNPHNLPPRIFAQKTTENAIYDHSGQGPRFGSGHDWWVYDKCNASNSSHSNLGVTYTNDTDMDGKNLLTGAYNFSVKEIEVFEVVGSS
jgi:hypothetical protein